MRFLVAVLFWTSGSFVLAQTLSFQAQQDLHGNAYANIWGYTAPDGREYALVGCQSGTAIVDVTNPASPNEITFIAGATSSWHEIQVWDQYAYVVSEGGHGVQIIDLSNLPVSASLVTEWTTPSYSATHDIQIRDGYAYLTGGNTTPNGGIKILSLENPTAPVEVGNFNQTYIHDCYVRNDTIYAAAIFAGRVYVIDVKDKANPQVVYDYTYPGGFTHNTALTDNGQHLFTTDETSSPPGRLLVWDISTLRDGIPGNTNITPVDTFGSTAIVHNVFAKGRFAFASYYTEGVRVWDISNPASLNLLGQYDTYPPSNSASFAGAWGVYPYFPSGTVVLSDISGGLFVLGFSLSESGIVKGIVTDSMTGLPIPGAKIYLLQDNLTRTSAGDGTYRIKALSGNSTFKIVAPGHTSVYQDVNVPVSDSVTVNFSLGVALPSPPANLSITKDSATVTLKWSRSPISNFNQYRIYGDTLPEPTILLDSIVNREDTTQTYENLTNGRTYYYRLTVVNTDGFESGYSAQLSAVPNPAPLNLRIAFYQNPVLTSSMDVLVTSDVDLVQLPTVKIWIGNDTTDVAMEAIDGAATGFAGRYALSTSGTYVVRVNGLSKRLVDSTKTRVLNVSVAKPGEATYLTSSDSRLTLVVGGDVVRQPTHFITEMRTEEDAQKYFFGPERDFFGDLRLESIVGEDKVQWFLERKSGDAWIPVGNQGIYGNKLVARTTGLGEFRLAKRTDLVNRVIESARLSQNYPNPFNPSTKISYELGEAGHVKLIVYNLLGQEVAVLVDGSRPAGMHEVTWNGKAWNGQSVASGVYFYRLFTASGVTTKKMLYIK